MKSPACVLLIVFMLLVAGITYAFAQTMRKSGSDVQIYDGSQWRSMNNATLGACSSSGELRYNSGAARLEFCNGSNWLSMDSGVNAGSCSGTAAGTVRYNGGVTQFCNGTNWRNSFVNALCGSAESGASTSAPSSNLCNPGSASSVSTNATTYTWTCTGSAGGDNDSCSKLRMINGSCSGSYYNCTAGTSNSGAIADTSTYWYWRCDGVNGGSNSSTCSQQRPGLCGSAESGASTSAPSSNLCTTGSATAVSTNSTTFTWSCNGSTNDSCSKPRQINGSCGSAASGAAVTSQPTSNQCSSGTYADAGDTGSYWQWNCNGINGGSSPLCQRARLTAVTGVCGSAESGASTSAPSSNLCSSGSASSVSTNSTTFTWSCNGSGGGGSDSCSKPRQINGSCGSAASGAAVTSQPTSNQCSSGTYADVGDTGSHWQWNCNGINGGSSPLCQRARSGGGGASCSGGSRGSNGCVLPSASNGNVSHGTCTGTGDCRATCSNGSWTSFVDNCGCQFC